MANSPNRTIGHGYAPEELTRAARIYAQAVAWRVACPSEWRQVVQNVETAALLHKRVSIARVSRGIMPAAYAPIAARLIARECPQIAHALDLGRSVYDYVMGS